MCQASVSLFVAVCDKSMRHSALKRKVPSMPMKLIWIGGGANLYDMSEIARMGSFSAQTKIDSILDSAHSNLRRS